MSATKTSAVKAKTWKAIALTSLMSLAVLYVGLACLTLVFQIYIRLAECTGMEGCAVSFAKAAVWSVIWPASWYIYISGLN